MRQAALICATALVMTGSVSACSDSDKKSGDGPGAKVTPAASIDPRVISPQDLPVPPTVRDPQGAIGDLTVGACETAPGKQRVRATLTSSAAARVDYLVTLSWTTERGDVQGRAFEVVRAVRPGETRQLTLKAKVGAGATTCVPGVVYGVIK